MVRMFASASLLLVALPSVPADEVRPKGRVPLFFVVTAVNKDGLVIQRSPVPTKEVFAELDHKVPFKGMDASDAKGKKLTPEEVAKRLKPGSVILVNIDGTPIDPGYLAIIKDETVILAGVFPPTGATGIKPKR